MSVASFPCDNAASTHISCLYFGQTNGGFMFNKSLSTDRFISYFQNWLELLTVPFSPSFVAKHEVKHSKQVCKMGDLHTSHNNGKLCKLAALSTSVLQLVIEKRKIYHIFQNSICSLIITFVTKIAWKRVCKSWFVLPVESLRLFPLTKHVYR